MNFNLYLLVRHQGAESGLCSVFERIDGRDFLVWKGPLIKLDETEFSITGEIYEEDLNL